MMVIDLAVNPKKEVVEKTEIQICPETLYHTY
jgi:hypothetical protein